MSLIDSLQPGVSLLDKQRGRERLVRAVERENTDEEAAETGGSDETEAPR